MAKLENDERIIKSNLYLKNEGGDIVYNDNGIPIVELGEEAEISIGIDPQFGFSSIKSLIGAQNELKIGDIRIGLKKILSGILQELYNHLIKYNPKFKKEDIKRLTLCVPNTFSPGKIEIMKRACASMVDDEQVRVIEKDNINIIRKAEAIVSCYVHEKNINDNLNFLVYDLGAKMLNIALVQLRVEIKEGKPIKVLDIIYRQGYPVGGNRLDVMFAEQIWDFYENCGKEEKHKGWTKNDLFDFKEINDKSKYEALKGARIILRNTSRGVKEGEDLALYGVSLNSQEVHYEFNNNGREDYFKLAIDKPLDNLVSYANSKNIPNIDKVLVTGRASDFPQLKERVLPVGMHR